MGSLRRQEKPRLSAPLPDARTGGPSSLGTAVSRRLSHGAFSAARSTARLRTPTCSSAASLTGAETARSTDPGQHLAATASGATWRHLLPSRRAETTVIPRSGISDQPRRLHRGRPSRGQWPLAPPGGSSHQVSTSGRPVDQPDMGHTDRSGLDGHGGCLDLPSPRGRFDWSSQCMASRFSIQRFFLGDVSLKSA